MVSSGIVATQQRGHIHYEKRSRTTSVVAGLGQRLGDRANLFMDFSLLRTSSHQHCQKQPLAISVHLRCLVMIPSPSDLVSRSA